MILYLYMYMYSVHHHVNVFFYHRYAVMEDTLERNLPVARCRFRGSSKLKDREGSVKVRLTQKRGWRAVTTNALLFKSDGDNFY